MFSLPPENWVRLVVWMAIGLVIYFSYSRHHSVMATALAREIGTHGVSPAGSPDRDGGAGPDAPGRH
jgi:APA family basic amino acid/polyamine antiporter